MFTIETGGTFVDIAMPTGDIAVVIQVPTRGNGPSPLSPALKQWLTATGILPRLSGLFTIYPQHLPLDRKNAPLKQLRSGWARVLKSIQVCAPQTKRILLMADTNTVRVAMPAIGKHADIGDLHGTIFTLGDGMELLPTFQLEYADLEQYKPWMSRDAQRCLRLVKPDKPLPFTNEVPEWLRCQNSDDNATFSGFVQTAASMLWLPAEGVVGTVLKPQENAPNRIEVTLNTKTGEHKYVVNSLRDMAENAFVAASQPTSSLSLTTSTMMVTRTVFDSMVSMQEAAILSLFSSWRAWMEQGKTSSSCVGTATPQKRTTEPARIKLAFDLETEGLDESKDRVTVLGMQWSDERRALLRGANVPLAVCLLQTCPAVSDIIGHNLQFDLGFMPASFRKAAYGRIRDTLIRAKARGELVAGLKHLSNLYTLRPGNYAWVDNTKAEHGFDDPAYVCEDLDATWRLFKLWESEGTKPVVRLFEKAIVMACEQTTAGSQLNLEALNTLADDGAALAERLRLELTDKYEVDPGQQELLTAKLRDLGYPLSKKTASGKDALTAEVLEELGLLDILEWRRAMKLDSAFVGKMRKLLRVDGTLPHRQVMLGADTGRTTMKDFNWQQAGRKGPVKGLLVSRFKGGKIAAVDLAQAELRVGCIVSQDELMLEWLQQKDAHRVNASNAFNVPFEDVTEDMRNDAKTIVFRLMYGGGSITDGQKRVEKYLRGQFSKLFAKLARDGNKAMEDRKITDAYGKTRNLLGVWDNRGKWGCKRAGINSPIQGLASHAAIEITLKIWELFREAGMHSMVLFGVHDSIVIDCHPAETEMVTAVVQRAFRHLMQTPFGQLPFAKKLAMEGDLQFGESWADTKNGDKIKCSSLSTPVFEDAYIPF